MKHQLYTSIDEMLTPKALSELAGQPVTAVRRLPLHSDDSKSGSHFLMVETNGGQGQRYILKRISMEWDWIMRATDDHLCRSVTLWQHGLYDRLPAEIEHGVVSCATEGSGWAILMRDVEAALLPYARFDGADNEHILDAMAALHATFLALPDLADPMLGLCNLRHVYTFHSPQTGRREAGGPDGHPRLILEGWDMLQTMIEPDVKDVIYELLENPQPLCNALSRYPQTLLHGDWRQANLGLLRGEPTQVILLDWQLAAVAPPAVELARYLGTTSALLPISKEAAIAYYQQSLAYRLGDRFEESWWRPQLELGLLGGFLQDGWAIALKATHWSEGDGARDHWQADVAWWSEQVRTGVKWL
jgi:hypothetical protein